MQKKSWIFNIIITVADYTSVFSVTWSFRNPDFMLKKQIIIFIVENNRVTFFPKKFYDE